MNVWESPLSHRWADAFNEQWDTKVKPHLDLDLDCWETGEGYCEGDNEGIVVQSHGIKFYIDMTADENGLPVFAQRPFWKPHAGN